MKKSLIPKIRRAIWFKLVALRLILLMFTLGISTQYITHAETITTNNLSSVQTDQAKTTQADEIPASYSIEVCGPICLLIVALIIIGVAAVIIKGLLDLCKKLNRPGKEPPDPNGSGPAQSGSEGSQEGFTLLSGPITSSQSMPTITLGDTNTVTGYTILPGTTNLDGSINVTNYDNAGNPYCVLFETTVISSTDINDWSGASKVCLIRGWVSFTYPQEDINIIRGGYRMAGIPQNVLIKCYTNNVLAAEAYYPAATTTDTATFETVPNVLIPKRATEKEFFRLMAPAQW